MSATPELPQPDPALRRLDAWSAPGAWKATWSAPTRRTSAARRRFAGCRAVSSSSSARTSTSPGCIDALELIGYDPETKTFPSTVYSNFSPEPLPYRWDVQGDTVTITVSYGTLDATFRGAWREDGTFSGGWRPNPGADETVNVPYDIGGRRLS